MKRKTRILIVLLAIFIAAMTIGIASSQDADVKTFRTPDGYEWKIDADTWEDMKNEAAVEYSKMRDIGSITPGYSDSIDITVTKGDKSYMGIAMAIKNDYYIRCEIRGLPDGQRLTVNDTDAI